MLLRDPPVVGGYGKRCAHSREEKQQEYPFFPVASHCVVCHVLYRSDCDRLHAAVRLTLPPSSSSSRLLSFPLSPPVPVVIKYISSADKCKMDDPPQLQPSWRLRYGKSAGHAAAVTARHRATSIFLLRENSRIESRTGKPIEAEYTIPSRTKRGTRGMGGGRVRGRRVWV